MNFGMFLEKFSCTTNIPNEKQSDFVISLKLSSRNSIYADLKHSRVNLRSFQRNPLL